MSNFSLEAENADHSMDWQEDKSIEEPVAYDEGLDGPPLDDPQIHLSTSGCTGQKRKSPFATPIPAKISKDICKMYQQQDENLSVNERNLHNNRKILSGISIVQCLNQMMQVEQSGIWSQVCSDNISSVLVDDFADRSKVTSADFASQISSFYPNISSGQRSIWSQVSSDNISPVLNDDLADRCKDGISTVSDFANQISSFEPNISSGYTLSQPSTSGDTGRKMNFLSSPSPAKISRDIWRGKQQHEDNFPLDKSNPYNNSKVASGFAISPSEDLRGVSCHSRGNNISASLVNDDTSCSKGDISTDFIHQSGVLVSVGEFHGRLSDLYKEGYLYERQATGGLVWSITKKDRWIEIDSYPSEQSNFFPQTEISSQTDIMDPPQAVISHQRDLMDPSQVISSQRDLMDPSQVISSQRDFMDPSQAVISSRRDLMNPSQAVISS